ncbi:MAG: hypothetical protein IKW93_02200 [Bacteroidales bacterium]|nr:hypothetical protein [Bacteroidales bacterium]
MERRRSLKYHLENVNTLIDCVLNDPEVSINDVQNLKDHLLNLYDEVVAEEKELFYNYPKDDSEDEDNVSDVPESPAEEPDDKAVNETTEAACEEIHEQSDDIQEPEEPKDDPTTIVNDANMEEIVVDVPIHEDERIVEISAQEVIEHDEMEDNPETVEDVEANVVEDTEIEENSEPEDAKNNIFQEQPTIADKISHARLDDLKSAIDISDKFLFIRTLFDNEVSAYNESIEKFNSMTSHNDAIIFIQHLAHKYNWDEDSDIYTKFVSIIERRFE